MKGDSIFSRRRVVTREKLLQADSFVQKLQVIDADSIGFHFPRKDFQNWIRGVIKDEGLAEAIDRIKEEQSNEDLRKEVVKTIETHLYELRNYALQILFD